MAYAMLYPDGEPGKRADLLANAKRFTPTEQVNASRARTGASDGSRPGSHFHRRQVDEQRCIIPTVAVESRHVIILSGVPEFAEIPLVARVPNGKIQDYSYNHE